MRHQRAGGRKIHKKKSDAATPTFSSPVKKKVERKSCLLPSRNRPLSSPAALNQIPRRGIDARSHRFPARREEKIEIKLFVSTPPSHNLQQFARKEKSWRRRRRNVRFRKCFSREFGDPDSRKWIFWLREKKCHARIQTTDMYI